MASRFVRRVRTASGAVAVQVVISGLEDHTVPDVSAHASFKLYRHSTAVTEFKQFQGRGHSLTIDPGWEELAETALQWRAQQAL